MTDGVELVQEMYMMGLPEHKSFIIMYDVACSPFLSATDGVVSNRGENTVGFQNTSRSILQSVQTGHNS